MIFFSLHFPTKQNHTHIKPATIYNKTFQQAAKQKYITIPEQVEMQDPYNYPFIQKDNTMYLSTITKNDFGTRTDYNRQSTFQKRDIEGTMPKTLIPKRQTGTNFALSTYVQPIPNKYKQLNKVSDSMRIDDIQGTRPKAHEFRTNRVVDPLQPIYQLPTANQISIDKGRNFIRDPMTVEDINNKNKMFLRQRGLQVLRQTVQGSHPMKLTKFIDAKQRLEVKDINKDGIFESNRHGNPLVPSYAWRDNQHQPNRINNSYGEIPGTYPKKLHPTHVNRINDFMLNTRDIEGTTSNSAFTKAHFIDKRKQFRNYMNVTDIQKTNPSSLKKGIQTIRNTNPLMPNYKFPGHSEIKK